MENYGDIKTIRKRKRYLKRLYRQCQNQIERETIGWSLIANIELLHYYTHLGNFSVTGDIGRILNECVVLIRDIKYKKLNGILRQDDPYMDENYLSFLMSLANYVADGNLQRFESQIGNSFDRTSAMNGAKHFYAFLQDEAISPVAEQILSDTSSIYFCECRNKKDHLGSTFFDYIFHKPYICILEHHDLRDLFTLIRECALGVKFYMKEDLHCDSFQNVCAYVMEELAFSYFETNETYREDIELLKKQRESDFTGYANDTLMQIHSLPGQQNLKSFFHPNVNEILKVIPRQLKKDLVEIQAYVMARGLVQQIQFNKELGLEHLKTLMRMNISNEQHPDFEKIGLGDDVLLTLAQEMSMRSKNVYSCYHEKKR